MVNVCSLGSYSEVVQGVRVTVVPEFWKERSDPEKGVYVYLYTVKVENSGARVVQLVDRHWLVRSEGRNNENICSEGGGGEQPLLEPAVSVEYSSWVVVDGPLGSLCGSYTFRNELGELFSVEIPGCRLIYTDTEVVH